MAERATTEATGTCAFGHPLGPRGGCRPCWNRNGQARYRARNAERGRASARVRAAVKSGRLTRQPCEVCGDAKAEGHHDDYSKPLDVRWLCKAHHEAHHRANGRRCVPSVSLLSDRAKRLAAKERARA